MKRRTFFQLGAGGLLGLSMLNTRFARAADNPLFEISLAEWSLNKHLFGQVSPKLDHLDFPKLAGQYGIRGLEYVNQFFMDKAKNTRYLQEMKQRAEDHGCQSLLIMCDREGSLGDPNDKKRQQAVENHFKWLEAAAFLGCHSIRVNAYSEGTFEEQKNLAADGLHKLCEKAQEYDLNVIVENHGGLSSNPDWLMGLIDNVEMPNFGMLPDFGNFDEYDPYRGVDMMMPYAKGVSAKAHFDAEGNCTTVDYDRMMRIVRDGGYHGFVGIESGASGGHDEMQAIQLTLELLKKVRTEQAQRRPILGSDLQNWTVLHGGDWTIDNGILIGTNGTNWSTNPEESGSWLCYNEPVTDFRLEFQYNVNPGGNSGVFFRSQKERNPAFTGYEMQIADCKRPEPTATCTPGAIYDTVTPSKIANKPAGEWNRVTLIAQGRQVIVEINGERIIDAELERSSSGFIGLQNHDADSRIQFKNIRLETFNN